MGACILGGYSSKAQIAQPTGKANVNLNALGIVEQITAAPEATKGTSYYDKEWRMGSIQLFDDRVIEGILLRYELKNQKLEFILPGTDEHKVINAAVVKSFQWLDYKVKKYRKFVNPTLMGLPKKEEIKGFLEEHCQGKFSVYEYHQTFLKSGYYLEIMAAGEKEDTWVKEKTAWIYADGELVEAPSRKKHMMEFLSKHNASSSTCKLNQFSYKTIEGLAALCNCLNDNS